MHYLFLVQKDLLLEHFFLTIQKPKVCHVARCMFLKWFSRIFHQKVFNKRIHQMVKNALHKFFRMIFMHSQKLTSNNFDDLTWQKKWNDKKNWVQPTRKGKWAIVPLSSSFSCFINKITSVQNKFPRWTSKCINFFFSPKYFFLFRSLSSAGCISVRESLSFQNHVKKNNSTSKTSCQVEIVD